MGGLVMMVDRARERVGDVTSNQNGDKFVIAGPVVDVPWVAASNKRQLGMAYVLPLGDDDEG